MPPILKIELIPKPTWGINARSLLTKDEWDTARKEVYKRSSYHCEICGGQGPNHPVECHEIWEFNEEKHIQKLAGLIALCPDCHAAKHYGRSTTIGIGDKVNAHLMRINGWTEDQLNQHIAEAYTTWHERNGHNWIVDAILAKEE